MGTTKPEKDVPLRGMDDLLAPLHAGEKPRDRFAIGTEAEKPGVRADGTPIPYEGDRGVRTVLERLAERYGWRREAEYEGGPLLALERGRASVTLEPAGQLELSGAPLRTIHETATELASHLDEVASVSADLDIAWLGIGFHPFATHADLPWVPKLRYGVMREYLPTRSPTGLDMMRRTSTVQANLDYASEADAMQKLTTLLRLGPVITAMFANSPFVEGRATGERSHRAHVWVHMDPDRSGLLPFAWRETPSYRAYVEWALDVPMFLVKRGDRIVPNTTQTFRTFMREGKDGLVATRADWETHLNTLFPEVRLKGILEIRGADAQSEPMCVALPALAKGLLYDTEALTRAAALASTISLEDAQRALPDIAARGLGADLGARPVVDIAKQMIEIAHGGLSRIADLDASGADETRYLAPLRALAEEGSSPADVLLRRVREGSFVKDVIAATRLR